MVAILKIQLRKGKKNFQEHRIRHSIPVTTRISLPVPFKGPEPVTTTQKAQQFTEKKSEPIVASSKSTKQAVECSPVVSAPKVDFAIDFFNMLSMDGPSVNSSGATSADDNAWARSAADKTGSIEPDAQKTHSSSGIEDLFQDSPYLVYAVSEKPQKDAKTDIMCLFDKAQDKYLIRSYPFDNIMKSVKSQQEEDEKKVSKREDGKNNKKANVKWSKHSVTKQRR
ncbi:hypothetical protein C3L33_10508, partial [Rhododendron williamsianum]